jgi:hypothetical protein
VCCRAAPQQLTPQRCRRRRRYLSYEVLNNDHSNLDKADMFALGITLYELASRQRLPTGGQRFEVLRKKPILLLTCNVQLVNLIAVSPAGPPRFAPGWRPTSCNPFPGATRCSAGSLFVHVLGHGIMGREWRLMYHCRLPGGAEACTPIVSTTVIHGFPQ